VFIGWCHLSGSDMLLFFTSTVEIAMADGPELDVARRLLAVRSMPCLWSRY
jgi:hypothetical protein